MRTFIAIELPKEIKDYLKGLEDKLRLSGADVKWVKPENIHLTLKFLGEIGEKQLAAVEGILIDTANAHCAFAIKLCSLGAFPSLNSARVIWVGIDKGDEETKAIASTLEEKEFSSHITIGRLKSGLNRIKLSQEMEKLKNSVGETNLEFQVTKLTLFQSTLTPQGPIYQALKEANLKTT